MLECSGRVCLGLVLLACLALVLPRPRDSAAQEAAKTESAGDSFSKEQIEFFEKQVQPILKARCLKCHGGEAKIRGGLRLSSRAALLKGGDQGPAVEVKTPADSLLLQAINYDGLEMPPSGKLPRAEIEILTRWVEQGAPWTPGATDEEAKPHEGPPRVDDEARNYWAYRPLHVPPVPQVKNAGWVRNPIDAFLLKSLQAHGLSPAPAADPVALIRRAYYDLTGLPPQPEEIDRFVADPSDAAYEKLIDRLLDSPQYGEKWGRHWLDLVRFAETHGYERDSVKPFAWRYRDYVINAFNSDKPYDQFLKEQLAGDELDVVTQETLIATGYYRLGLWDDEPADRLLAKYDVLDGIVSTTGQLVLGMTVGCARCHDHKKDPLPQRDYYRMLAFFRDVTDMNPKNTRMYATDEHRQIQARLLDAKQKRETELHQQLAGIEQQFVAALARKGIKIARRPLSDLVDLKFRLYRDTWERLPEFDSLKVETTGDLPHNFVTLGAASRNEAIGLVFEGQLRVPQPGEFSFNYDATEGLRLVVAGRKIIDHSGRGRHQGTERVALDAGLVPVRIEYFNTDKKPELKLSWQGPGVELRSLTDDSVAAEGVRFVADSRKDPQEWVYTLTAPAGGWSNPSYDESQWQHGQGGFGTAGTPGAVVRTRWNTKDIWLRKAFRVERVPERVSIDLHHDDEIEIYLNGRLVYEKQGFLIAYQRIMLPPEAAQALVVGDNVLAVHCHQTTGGQYVDVGLSATTDGEIMRSQLFEQADQVLEPGTAAKYKSLSEQLDASRNRQPPEIGTEIMCVAERGREKTHVLIRGNPGAQGDVVEPGFPLVLTSAAPMIRERPTARDATSGKRRALAEWLTSPENPVTPRVMANRLWQFHFGRGIVPTPNDFGKLGEPPTHPELLEWLAGELIRRAWRMKDMHRLIMRSSAYRMSSRATREGLERDPANRLFWRFNMRRLAAEEVRDSILAASGTLNLKAGGPGVYPPIPRAVLAGQSVPGSGWGNSPPEEASRRSIYVHVKRSLLVPILSQHDMADTDSSCAARFTTTVPTQALGMLNGEFTNEQAIKVAERLERDVPGNLPGQIARGIRLTTSRPPTDVEIQSDVAFVKKLQIDSGLNARQALVQYCLLLLNANEFVYLD